MWRNRRKSRKKRNKFKIKKWQPPKINLDKGRRPIHPKVEVDYSFDKASLKALEEKYKPKETCCYFFDLWWPTYDLKRTSSSPNILFKSEEEEKNNRRKKGNNRSKKRNKFQISDESDEKESNRRPHSTRYPRHYLEWTMDKHQSNKNEKIKKRKKKKNKNNKFTKRDEITIDNIELIELKYLVHGYVRQQYRNYIMIDVMELIVQKFDLLPKFEDTHMNTVGSCVPRWVQATNIRQVMHSSPGTMVYMYTCLNNYRRIYTHDCDKDGFICGVHYCTLNIEKGGCRNNFGVTTKNHEIENIEHTFPEILKAKDIKEYYLPFSKYSGGHGGGIITIKLDCNNWTVTFFKDYGDIIKYEEIEPNHPYWFYINYCTTGNQLFEIVKTDYYKLSQVKFAHNLINSMFPRKGSV